MNEARLTSEELEKFVPKVCPFCWEEGKAIRWTEFRAYITDTVFIETHITPGTADWLQNPSLSPRGVVVQCSRCNEELQQADVERGNGY